MLGYSSRGGLADSLPKEKLDRWREEREIWLGLHPQPWDEETEDAYHDRFSSQIDKWLDRGSGSCLLKDPKNGKIVADALQHFNGVRYELALFVVMPNHVHVLFRPLGEHALADIVKSWKGFAAREINKRRGTKGSLWQDEYWDQLIRTEHHFHKVASYIRENPVVAKLRKGEFEEWGFSSSESCEKGGQECPPSFLPGRLEAKVKSFCSIPQVLGFLKEYILFAGKDEELNKYILRQQRCFSAHPRRRNRPCC